MRKARQDAERQKLINVFIDETGGDTALFRTQDGIAFADLMIAGHRETWPIRSRQFRAHYIRYLQLQFNRLVVEQSIMAAAMKASMRKSAVNAAIDDFELLRAIATANQREVSRSSSRRASCSCSI
jgi:hypothetical protein